MFLERIEMQGFKSFADRTIITFEKPITGIVGPNGCGKSNIADAVRWVLGEQSAKSLRGEKMNDVIFAGSADRRKVNMAEVTLVFDNSGHVLNSDKDELYVTRRLYRDSNEAEYLINNEPARLRDIVNLFLDTGLGKESLSLISQGTVIQFADAKPYDRRGIFEEAAGVAKYKKRKLEALSRLERTRNNLERSNDILTELEKQVSPLKRQARKAEIYRAKKKLLEQIEVTVLVNEIDQFVNDIEMADKTLFDIETRLTMFGTNIQIFETQIAEGRKIINDIDSELSSLQEALIKNVNEIQALEARRTESEEKSKYIIQTGSFEQKTKELKELTDAAAAEYEDRKSRLDQLNAEIDLMNEKFNGMTQIIFDKRTAYEHAQGHLRSLENRKNVLDQLIKNPFANMNGVNAVMANKNALPGILGVIGQVLKIDEGYEEAISIALGGAMNDIVTEDEEAARNAINFLKRNLSGRATFLPLTVCSPRYISKENMIICQNTKGYLGIAADFVANEEIYDPIVENLLQNVPVVDCMETGNELSFLTRRMYKIVTLDGEVIHRGGSMTGGKARHNTNIITMKKEAKAVSTLLDSEEARVKIADKELKEAELLRDNLRSQLQEKRIAEATLEPIVEAKLAKYERLKSELSLIEPDNPDEPSYPADDLIIRLNKAYEKRDGITSDIKSYRQKRIDLSKDIDRREIQLKQMRKDLNTAKESSHAINLDKTKLETKMAVDIERLASEYKMTYEFAKTEIAETVVDDARQQVAQLRSDIERLGNINMNAPEEYSEINQRYETLKGQIDELVESRDKILNAIDEMDEIMKTQFRQTFDAINLEFNNVFQKLYGGGKASLVLVDPDDLLNTGIDIDAQPPGKNVRHNMLFSGGEKSLISLCVLFAILKVKPSPMVILDEVEAALDPNNVERFAQFLKNYINDTQFIIVTHRPGTMENTDVLYGVTMQRQGVSQMLKVELKDAMNMADRQAAEN